MLLALINRITHVTVDGIFYIYLLLGVIFKFSYDLMIPLHALIYGLFSLLFYMGNETIY
jgi:hypothetical protein